MTISSAAFRLSPLSISEYEHDFRETASELQLIERIFCGGIASNKLRVALWPYLFKLVENRDHFVALGGGGGSHKLEQPTADSQYAHVEHPANTERWAELKLLYYSYQSQWESIKPDQELRFSTFRERKSLIERDVIRSDRSHPFYADSAQNLDTLTTLLMTYMMYDFDIGYLQGMSDLAAPILYVFNGNLVKSFWVFVEVMKLFRRNFEFTQKTIHFQLNCLFKLVKLTDPKFAQYLKESECSNCFFAFRCIVCQFKRELMKSEKENDYTQVLQLWDTIWSVQRRHELMTKSKIVHTYTIAANRGQNANSSARNYHKRKQQLMSSMNRNGHKISPLAQQPPAQASHQNTGGCHLKNGTATHGKLHQVLGSCTSNNHTSSSNNNNNNNNNNNDAATNGYSCTPAARHLEAVGTVSGQLSSSCKERPLGEENRAPFSRRASFRCNKSSPVMFWSNGRQQQQQQQQLSPASPVEQNQLRHGNSSNCSNNNNSNNNSNTSCYHVTAAGNGTSIRHQFQYQPGACQGSPHARRPESMAEETNEEPVKQEQILYTKQTFYSSFDPNQADVPRFELTETEKFVLALCLSLIRRDRNHILKEHLDASEIHQHFIDPKLAKDLESFIDNAYQIYHFLNTDCDLQALVKGADATWDFSLTQEQDTFDLLKDYHIISPSSYDTLAAHKYQQLSAFQKTWNHQFVSPASNNSSPLTS